MEHETQPRSNTIGVLLLALLLLIVMIFAESAKAGTSEVGSSDLINQALKDSFHERERVVRSYELNKAVRAGSEQKYKAPRHVKILLRGEKSPTLIQTSDARWGQAEAGRILESLEAPHEISEEALLETAEVRREPRQPSSQW